MKPEVILQQNERKTEIKISLPIGDVINIRCFDDCLHISLHNKEGLVIEPVNSHNLRLSTKFIQHD